MAIVRIPTPLRKFTGGQEEVAASGANVRDVLEELERLHPGIKSRLYDDAGAIRKFINIFAGSEDIRYLQNLDTAIGEKDELSIIPAIAGGR